MTTQAEDISLRFRTSRPVGLLLTTWSPVSSDRLELALLSGQLRLLVKLGDRDLVSLPILSNYFRQCFRDVIWPGHEIKNMFEFQVVYSGHGLNDDQWHTVRFNRRATFLTLQVDNDNPTPG